MKTLEEIKDEVAQSMDYKDWDAFYYNARDKEFNKAIELIANAKAKALLEEADEKMPTDDEIEAGGKEGGLRDNELQLYWEGGTEWRNKVRDIFLSLIPKEL